MTLIKLDGISYKVNPPDVDGDGKTGGTENLQQNFDRDITNVVQPTELGESLKQSFEDKLDPETRMTSIDMKTRISNTFERNAMMSIDSLVALRFLPISCLTITRQAKRLNVSMKGEGRKEIVDIISGKREHDKQVAGGGLFNGVKNAFGGGN